MSEAVVGNAVERPSTSGGLGMWLRASVLAWHNLTWRHWAAAMTLGFTFGVGQSLWYVSRTWDLPDDYSKLEGFLWEASIWTPLFTITACLLMLGLAVLEHSRANTPPRHYALLVFAIAVPCVLIVHPSLYMLIVAIDAVFKSPGPWSGFTLSWSVPLKESLNAAGSTFIMLTLWTLVYLYLRDARGTALRLGAAQLRHAEAERRVLAEQLNGAQAMVEPAFLFDTLTLTEELFERDPPGAQHLLDALIAYLRAALPSDDSGSTLGQQVELVRARLEIECVRMNGSLHFSVEMPAELAGLPLAPLLLMPLALNAIRHGIEASGGEVSVQARQVERRLVVDVTDTGPGQAGAIRDSTGLAGVRERLARLYGERARLVLTDREPQGLCARIEVSTEGIG